MVETGKIPNKVDGPQVVQLLDDILDAVLALKARLADSSIDTNSIGGILFSGNINRNAASRLKKVPHHRFYYLNLPVIESWSLFQGEQ